jgi:small subunit ribosomal protein S9
MSEDYYYGTGRRKEAVARVRLYSGGRGMVINAKSLEEAFPSFIHRLCITEPLRLTQTEDRFEARIKVEGGGVSGQAESIRHGISRALVEADPGLKPLLRSHGLLTRDARVKERKKYGLKRARKAKQYRKR